MREPGLYDYDTGSTGDGERWVARGQTMVEFAICAAIFFVVILGIIQSFLWISETSKLRMALLTAASETAPIASSIIRSMPYEGLGGGTQVYGTGASDTICISSLESGEVSRALRDGLSQPLRERALELMGLTGLSYDPSVDIISIDSPTGRVRDYQMVVTGEYRTKSYLPTVSTGPTGLRVDRDMTVSYTITYTLDLPSSASYCP